MKHLLFDPSRSGSRMTIVCFVSGSGTNYDRIVARDPNHDYLVFTNRPGCGGAEKARRNGHPVITLDHQPYLKDARARYGAGNVPRNCPERTQHEQDAWRLIEGSLNKAPDLVCMAGYDQWTSDWLVDKCYPRLLNVHPGDTTRDYAGLHWIPTAMAILAGDKHIRSTLFLVDKSEDKGPVLVQSRPLDIVAALRGLEAGGKAGLLDSLQRVIDFAASHSITTYEPFRRVAGPAEKAMMKRVCEELMEALKIAGDWEIYPFAVHDLIGAGRVAVDARTIYVDGRPLPPHGYRMDDTLG